METHVCTGCYQPVEDHPAICYAEEPEFGPDGQRTSGHDHMLPLCCPECGCGSFAEAHPSDPAVQALVGPWRPWDAVRGTMPDPGQKVFLVHSQWRGRTGYVVRQAPNSKSRYKHSRTMAVVRLNARGKAKVREVAVRVTSLRPDGPIHFPPSELGPITLRVRNPLTGETRRVSLGP